MSMQPSQYRDNQPLMSGGGGGGGYGPGGYGPGGGFAPPGNSYGPGGGYGPGAGYSNNPYATGGGGPYSTGSPPGSMAASGNHMNDVYFGAAMCIVVGSMYGGISLFFSFKTVEWIQITYLMLFGLALAVLDTPFLKSIKAVQDMKMYISKYIQFVTRVTGKGITLIFLGSMLFLTLWQNVDGGLTKFLAVVLGFFPTLVGVASLVIGVLKSTKLEKSRKMLMPAVEHVQDNNGAGFTTKDFNELTERHGGIHFEALDLKLVFNALMSNPAWQLSHSQQSQGGYSNVNVDEPRIPKQDLIDWCRGGMVFL